MASILIVDDEAPVRDALAGLLESLGHRITEACNGCEALERFEQDRFDLILTDVIMPKMNGFDLIRQIQLRINHRIPLVILSSHGDPAGVQSAIYAGAFDYIMKPAEAGTVLEVVERALEQGRTWAAEGTAPPPPVPSLATVDDDPTFKQAGPAAFATRQQSVTVPLPPTAREPEMTAAAGPFGRILKALHLR